MVPSIRLGLVPHSGDMYSIFLFQMWMLTLGGYIVTDYLLLYSIVCYYSGSCFCEPFVGFPTLFISFEFY